MKLKFILSLICIIFLSTIANANQAVYVTKSQAENAISLLKEKSVILHYCETCKDKNPWNDIIEKVEMVKAKGKYWTIKINEKQVDLAYVFIKEDGEWKNLARKLKIKVRNVSTSLPMDRAR